MMTCRRRKPGTESMESLFAQELEKRSLSFDEEEEEIVLRVERLRALRSRAAEANALTQNILLPSSLQSSSGGQLDKSRALQSEGLEGLPDRARELLTLGSTFFLAFCRWARSSP